MGVRSSWLTFARNAVFTRLAASAVSASCCAAARNRSRTRRCQLTMSNPLPRPTTRNASNRACTCAASHWFTLLKKTSQPSIRPSGASKGVRGCTIGP